MSPVSVPAIGSFIREQREQAKISLRQLAQAAGVSNPYLSQIERGLRRPSADILQQIAKGLRISAEALYVQAGFLEDRPPGQGVRDAVLGDPELTERQKQMLLEVYDSFRRETAGRGRTVLAGETAPSGEAGEAGETAPSGEAGETGELAPSGEAGETGELAPSGEAAKAGPAGAGKTGRAGAGKTVRAGAGKTVRAGAGKTVPAGAGKTVPAGTGKTVRAGTGKTVPAGTGKTVPAGVGKAGRPGARKTRPAGPGEPGESVPPSEPGKVA